MEILEDVFAEYPAREGWQAAELSGTEHSRRRDRRAISYHYDVSNDFYALWLDRRLVYSCGYFADPGDDIHTAQERKLDYICRKLRLEPGERLLDIGCGWGALVVHAAKHYGVEALGITLSQPQVDLASERIAQEGLSDRCGVEYLDYREVAPERPFDKLVSVGMFEHVGEVKMCIPEPTCTSTRPRSKRPTRPFRCPAHRLGNPRSPRGSVYPLGSLDPRMESGSSACPERRRRAAGGETWAGLGGRSLKS